MMPPLSRRISRRSDSCVKTLAASRILEGGEIYLDEFDGRIGNLRFESLMASLAFASERAPSQISLGSCLANRRTDSFPRPLLPPVTRMTLSFNEGMLVSGLNLTLLLPAEPMFGAVIDDAWYRDKNIDADDWILVEGFEVCNGL